MCKSTHLLYSCTKSLMRSLKKNPLTRQILHQMLRGYIPSFSALHKVVFWPRFLILSRGNKHEKQTMQTESKTLRANRIKPGVNTWAVRHLRQGGRCRASPRRDLYYFEEQRYSNCCKITDCIGIFYLSQGLFCGESVWV